MSPDDLPENDGSLRELLAELARAPDLAPERPPSPLAVGDRVGRFELLRELGVGSFGMVFEARDTELGRHVAIKLLRADRLGPPGSPQRAERLALFRSEAETSAKLHHPNLITLHDFGVHGDQPYLVLELLRGETLDARLARGPLPPAEALRITADICRALVHAHAAGVMHGDLSLGNVMRTVDGTVKVLDLGLSRLFGGDARGGGTTGFIAPEKMLGDPADARSDVFATGVLLFCLLRGERKPPRTPPLSRALADDARRSLPSGLSRIAARALDPQPAQRHQTARELLDALEQVRPASWKTRARQVALFAAPLLLAGLAFQAFRGSRPDPSPSVAVLPFLDLSEHKDQDYFADGIAEEILDALTKVEGLRVIARTSSFSFKGKNEDLRTVGKELGAANLLEGSVRKEGNRIRITAQLISARDGVHLWSQTFDRDLTSVLAVQEEIARTVAGKLERKLVAARARAEAPSPAVLEQVLLGRHFFLQGWPDGYGRSVAAYQKAVDLDPRYAPGWAGLGMSLYNFSNDGKTLAAVLATREKSFAAIDQAIALDPELAEAYAYRGRMRLGPLEWTGAASDLQRATQLQPGDADVQSSLASLHTALGQLDEAIRFQRKTAELDPLNASTWGRLAMLLAADGQLDAARAAATRGVEIAPGRVLPAFALGVIEILTHKPGEALPLFAKIEEKDVFAPLGAALALHDLGRQREAEEAMAPVERNWAHVASYNIAEVYAWWGDKDRAFAFLERSSAQHDNGLFQLKLDPLLRGLHGDPRYARLLKKLNLPPD